jgi:hypothetical protein
LALPNDATLHRAVQRSGTVVWKAREDHAAGKIDHAEFMDIVT